MRPALPLSAFLVSALLLSPLPASAGDVAVSDGELSLDDFYRTIACGADAGGECRTEMVRWPKQARQRLRVHINAPQAGFPAAKAKVVAASVRLAVNEINISGADIQLQVVDDPSAPIQISMLETGYGKTIRNSGDPLLDGMQMRATLEAVELKPGTHDIDRVSIAISGYIAKDLIRGAVLTETLKAIGLPYQIDNPWYDRKSVFTEIGYGVYRVRRQDMLALRLHYPTNCLLSECLQR